MVANNFKYKCDSRIGVIADTHGLLRPSVIKAFKNVDLIVHAGDIEKQEVLDALQEIAPVHAVYGNIDKGVLVKSLQKTDVVKVGKVYLYVLHDVSELDLTPAAAGFNVVVSGHSHIPNIEEKDGVLFLNPGSAGPRRFTLPISVAILYIKGTSVIPELLKLKE